MTEHDSLKRFVSFDVLNVPPHKLGLLSTIAPGSGAFSQEAIDRAIARAAQQVPEGGHGAIVAHYGTDGNVEASIVANLGDHFSVQLTRDHAELLELTTGQIVYIKPTRQTTFT